MGGEPRREGNLKKFEFRLEKLLEIRRRREDEEKIELARASGAYQIEVNRKEKILHTLREYRKDILSGDRLDAGRLRAFDQWVKASDFAVHDIEKTIEEKRLVMEEHVKKYTGLKRDRRAVEILREKAWDQWRRDERREETAELDETGATLYRKGEAGREDGGLA